MLLCWEMSWELNMLIGSLFWVACLLHSSLCVFPPLKTHFLQAQQLLDRSLTDSQSIEVGFFSIDSQHLLNRSRYPYMHFIFLCFAFFSFMSIASCFSFSSRSIVPCSPRSHYISFLFVSGQVFLAFYALWQLCQKGGEFWELNVIPQKE